MASSSTESSLGAAKLCANCQTCALRDDDVCFEELHRGVTTSLGLKDQYQNGPRRRFGSSCHGACIPTPFKLKDGLPELPKLMHSSQNGCEFCSFLRQIILSEDVDCATVQKRGVRITEMIGWEVNIHISHSWGMQELSSSDDNRIFTEGLDGIRVGIDLSSPHSQTEESIILELICVAESETSGTDAVSQWLKLPKPTPQSYCDDESIVWMQARLRECERHEHKPTYEQSFVPERLVDVSGDVPRLVSRSDVISSHEALTSGRSDVVKYSALSYCWGPPSCADGQLKTTTDTLPNRESGIQDEEMTAVLRDAVLATRSLSIQYLWIDALCILQDDILDWERQCTEMLQIYGKAYVTLCAASSRSCQEGFIHRKGQRMRFPFQSLRNTDVRGSYHLQFEYVTANGFRDELVSTLFNDIKKDNFTWHTRGWTYQEEFLSTRRLVFGAHNVHFVCGDLHHTRGQEHSKELFNVNVSITPESLHMSPHSYWDGILQDYSIFGNASYSKLTDVLPALSGLARLVYNLIPGKDSYYAGHWERSLIWSIMWFTPDTPKWSSHLARLQSQNPFIVPSWSRLTRGYTELAIPTTFRNYTRCDIQTEVQSIRPHATLASTNPFGALEACSISVRSHTIGLNGAKFTISATGAESGIATFVSLSLDDQYFASLYLDFKPDSEDTDILTEGWKLEDFEHFELLLLGSNLRINNGNSDEESDEAKSHCSNNEGTDKATDNVSETNAQSEQEEGEVTDEETDDDGHLEEDEIEQSHGRQAYGLVLYATGNTDEYFRVGIFFSPGKEANLSLFKRVCTVKTVTVV